jgi:hypothetical protein
MSTSTNSAGLPLRGDLLLAVALVASLLMADVAVRLVDDRLSGNLAHVAQIPAIFEAVGSSGDPRSTLLLGNSLTGNGVDAEELARAAGLAHVGKVAPDGTSYWDWQCLLHHELLDHPQRKVSTLVVGTAWHLMSDETQADASRLGALYCRLSDLASPADIGIVGPGQIGEFIAARALRLYALRDTLRNRVLAMAIPDYKRFANEQNAEHTAAGAANTPSGAARPVEYTRLTTLASRLEAHGTRLIVLMMPAKHPYDIDPALRSLDAQGHIRLLDYRNLPGIEATSFIDDMHLGAQGRSVLTAQLARDLATEDAAR